MLPDLGNASAGNTEKIKESFFFKKLSLILVISSASLVPYLPQHPVKAQYEC